MCEHVCVHGHACNLGKGSLQYCISKWITIILIITSANVERCGMSQSEHCSAASCLTI